MIKVLEPGFYSTIQDLGRFGYRKYGVPVSGAMDGYSSQFVNMILGNEKKAAVMEITMSGPKLEFLKPTTIAISGALMQPMINGTSIAFNKSIKIEKHDILSFGKLNSGFRSYIGITGGFHSKPSLGSRSMYEGVTESVQIKKNEYLGYQSLTANLNHTYAHVKYNQSYLMSKDLKVLKGPEFNDLTKVQQNQIFDTTYVVSKFHNRMAYQLEPNMKHNLSSILTAPVLPGTVQLTPSGQLIVLMRDCQTTGGYPRVLQLSESAINTLSQKATNNKIRFKL
ncbi:MAG: biotin-dependent carboxyltransferase family protein [Winogradskyella sp.]|uniref:5-oxoprolinase subunit C family protein n=1 Tax=Winogradskyella sp. TaxID=1883156 RepID=UPI00180780D5|nr:biotin-dependent carboxyltransferase family protein [Winogradskyella sp.]